jgi:hypothetical protein
MIRRLFGAGMLLIMLSFWLIQPALSEDQVIDHVMEITTVTGADDLVAELQDLAQGYVADPNDYGGIGIDFTKSKTVIMYFRGSTVSTMAMILPLLPGSTGDTTTLRGKLAARLKADVLGHLLRPEYWEWERATTTGEPYLQPANPIIPIDWDHFWHVGPHWEKMHALWAYAYYTGDWATIQANWSFIKERYDEGYKTPDSRQRVQIAMRVSPYRNGINDLANGLIGYVRMAERMHDPTAAQARVEAGIALDAVLQHVDVSWANAPTTYGWDNVPDTLRGEWTPGYNLTPELGRWINDRARAVAQQRLDEASNAGELRGHWWAGYANNVWSFQSIAGEDRWGMPNLSHQLFLGRAWMLQEGAAELRQVKPWHVVMGSIPEYRDMLYIRSLYALISRHAQVTWLPAN